VKVLRGVHLTGVSTRERTPKFLQSAVGREGGSADGGVGDRAGFQDGSLRIEPVNVVALIGFPLSARPPQW
jgi:hypothetical protein